MVGTGHVDKGAIYSLAGDSKWAGSAGFEVCPDTSTMTFNIGFTSQRDIEDVQHMQRC